jgi:hypothetical protein
MWQDVFQKLIIKIDDYYVEPVAVRSRALAMAYATPPSQLNANTFGPIAEYVACDDASRNTLLNRLKDILPSDIATHSIEFRFVHAGTQKRQVCHADGTHMAGIVHLSLPEHGRGTTVFFQHKPTGDLWERPERLHLYDYRNKDDWEEVYRVESAFNRLALYPGKLFHAIGTPYFGDRAENARLTQVMFLNLVNDEPIQRALSAI